MKSIDSIEKVKTQVSQLIRQLGWLNTVLYIFSRLLSMISHNRIRLYKYYLIAQPVAKKSLFRSGKEGSIVIREINEGDDVTQFFPRPGNAIKNRFRSGAKCLVAFKNNEFVGFLWLLFDNYQEDEVRARFSPLPSEQTAWDFDVYVVPNFRLGRVFARLWSEANNILRERKIIWSCSRISAFNSNSLRSHTCLGAELLGSTLFLCVGTWQISFASIFPYFHLSFNNDSFPEYLLKTNTLKDSYHLS